ncbi:Protein of unknown function [Bacillus cytotoxicus]|uniref:Uncharacterized protein n=1 Tax=Bacillus cytotoxicus TaxID=580165 RepID=A0AAX2CPK7_9BACI|nr:Protein of unknown function [Bacillus cytotoxicus]
MDKSKEKDFFNSGWFLLLVTFLGGLLFLLFK